MTEEKWQNLLLMIEDKFKIEEKGEDMPEDKGVDKIEFVVFTGPMGRIKLERLTKPVVLGKKTIFSKRAGSETAVDYEYSPDEKYNELKAYKWNQDTDSWAEIEAGDFLG